MSIPGEEGTRQRDVLSIVLDSLDVRCRLAGETVAGGSRTTGARDVGPVFFAVLEGTCWSHRPGRNPVELAAGDLLVLPLGGTHRLCDAPSVSGAPSDRQTSEEMMDLRIASRGADARLLQATIDYLAPRPHPLCYDLPGEIYLKGTDKAECQPVLAPALRAVECELCEPRAGTASVLDLLGRLVFVEAVRRTVASHVPIRPGLIRALSDPELAPTLALAYRTPAYEWTLESLAHEAGMSRSSFARRFKEVMGIPAMTWITDLRMRLASNLLRDRTVGVKEVATKAGYASATSFSTAFKRWAGHAPSQCRTSLRDRSRSDTPVLMTVAAEAGDN